MMWCQAPVNALCCGARDATVCGMARLTAPLPRSGRAAEPPVEGGTRAVRSRTGVYQTGSVLDRAPDLSLAAFLNRHLSAVALIRTNSNGFRRALALASVLPLLRLHATFRISSPHIVPRRAAIPNDAFVVVTDIPHIDVAVYDAGIGVPINASGTIVSHVATAS